MRPGHQRQRAATTARGQAGRGQERRGEEPHGDGEEGGGGEGAADGARHVPDDGQDEAAGAGEPGNQENDDDNGASDREIEGGQRGE